MNLDQQDVTRVRFWTSQTNMTFAQVTIKDIKTGSLITHHLSAIQSGLLYDRIRDALTTDPPK